MATLETFESDQQFDVDFIREMHRQWLGDIYDFAGEFRRVNVSKDGFLFCAAPYVDSEMKRYEKLLASHTPCDQMSPEQLVTAMAEVHGEFILIHPFREGNGRLGRWITSLMAIQAGYPVLSFGLEGNNDEAKLSYFSAVRRFATDSSDLIVLFREVLNRTIAPENSLDRWA